MHNPTITAPKYLHDVTKTCGGFLVIRGWDRNNNPVEVELRAQSVDVLTLSKELHALAWDIEAAEIERHEHWAEAVRDKEDALKRTPN